MKADIQFQSGSDIDRLIALSVAQDAGHRAHLLRAVKRGEIITLEPHRKSHIPKSVLRSAPLPTLVIIGDDDHASTGPAGWTATQRVLKWARAAMIHGAGADIRSYQMVIDMTVKYKRVALIETESRYVAAWGEVFLSKGIPSVGIIPSDGPHPIRLDRGAAH